MLSIFLESLPLGLPSALSAIVGFFGGLKFDFRMMGAIGSAVLIVSFGLIAASLFVVPAVIGDCRTDQGHALLNVHLFVTFALSWIGALGAGLLAARTWKMHRVAGAALALAVFLAAIPYGYLTVFAVGFRPGCYV